MRVQTQDSLSDKGDNAVGHGARTHTNTHARTFKVHVYICSEHYILKYDTI